MRRNKGSPSSVRPFEDNLKNLGAFRQLRETIDKNFNEYGNPLEFKGTPREMVRAYLSHTPLFQLFAVRVPFELTQFKTAFRAHGAVFAPTDWGKTRLLEHLIVNFLKEDDPPPMFIMDSMGAMLKKIERLEVFAGRLKDRLVVLDPTDHSPPALNIFKLRAGSGQRSSLAPAQETELFFYLFKAIDQQLTTRQATTIYYMTKLMQAVPGSNLDTLLQLCESKQSIFTEYMADLPGKAQGFFTNQFFGKNDPFVQQTKQQIAQRLYTIGTNELFDAMFGATDNKFDATDCIAQKKIVLVNTSRARLGEGGSTIFGRYILAQCLAAAFARASIPERDRHLAVCFVDEVKAYADEQIKTILSDARQFGMGIFMATQAPHQIERAVRDEIFTNTSLRLSGNFDNNSLADSIADNMQTTRQAIQSLERKDYAFTEFMTYVRGETRQGAVKLRIPMTTISKEPTMNDAAWEAMRDKNRETYGASARPIPVPPKPKTVGHKSSVFFNEFGVTLPCLLDTGASSTFVPAPYTVNDNIVTFQLGGQTIERPLLRMATAVGFDGSQQEEAIVQLVITIEGHTAIEEVGLCKKGDEILIGRTFMAGRLDISSGKPFKW